MNVATYPLTTKLVAHAKQQISEHEAAIAEKVEAFGTLERWRALHAYEANYLLGGLAEWRQVLASYEADPAAHEAREVRRAVAWAHGDVLGSLFGE